MYRSTIHSHVCTVSTELISFLLSAENKGRCIDRKMSNLSISSQSAVNNNVLFTIPQLLVIIDQKRIHRIYQYRHSHKSNRGCFVGIVYPTTTCRTTRKKVHDTADRWFFSDERSFVDYDAGRRCWMIVRISYRRIAYLLYVKI